MPLGSRSSRSEPVFDSLEAFAREKLAARERAHLRRDLDVVRLSGREIEVGGRTYVSFAGNDYLGLSGHPRVIAEARAASAGATASRLVVGNHGHYPALEAALARESRAPAALVFGSGYLVNAGVIPSLIGPADLIVLDELVHACMHAGARLSGARILTFRHGDLEHAHEILAAHRAAHPRCLLGTEGVFGMDGDLSDIAGLVEICGRFDAWLMVDDAHGTGVLEGGAVGASGVHPSDGPLKTGTLSKALGSYGGFLACSEAVRAMMVNRARTFVYSTGLPPSVVAAGRAALEVLEQEPWSRTRVRALGRRLASGLDLPAPATAIVPIILGSAEAALEARDVLRARGLWVAAIRPPTVPPGTARLRVSLSAEHQDRDIDALIDALSPLRSA